MKIIIVDTTIHGLFIGGGHLFLPGLMKGLVQKGHEVHLIVSGPPNEKVADFINKSGAIVHERPWKKKGLTIDIAPLFADWVNQINPDIFLISSSADIGWVALPFLNPAIATLTIGHNDAETFYLPARHYHSFLTRTIGVSHEICDYYASSCSIPSDRIQWIPYGVQTCSTPPVGKANGSLKIVYVGRVVEEQKRISDLIAIAKELTNKKMDFKLTIVGDGPDMPKVKILLDQQIKEGTVELKGWLTNAEIIDIVQQSEVFVLTSAYEGFCIALIEAMANGCCPIVTDIRSGNKELVRDAVNGFVVTVGDIKKFTERLIQLTQDRNKLSELRTAAWKEGAQYSIERMIETYEKCFHKASADAKAFLRQPDAEFPILPTCRSKYPKWLRNLKVFIKAD